MYYSSGVIAANTMHSGCRVDPTIVRKNLSCMLAVVSFLDSKSCVQRAAEQSMHLTCGSLRSLQTFFWLRAASRRIFLSL